MENLLERLKKRTKHRILRTDKIPNVQRPKIPRDVRREDWDLLTENMDWDRENRLWVQYTVNAG